jgi:hypothetical protein
MAAENGVTQTLAHQEFATWALLNTWVAANIGNAGIKADLREIRIVKGNGAGATKKYIAYYQYVAPEPEPEED